MQAEIIVVGSELLLGQIIDTNSAFIARELAAMGLDLFFKTTVGDNRERLEVLLRQALGRSHVVITTGGIGPTADDITREAVAAATGRELVFSEPLMAQIEAFFAARGFTLSPSNRRQAYVPAGAIAIENPVGTAPAFIVEVGPACVVTLPGVPREMQHLLITRVLPYLRDRYRLVGEIKLRVLKTVGLGESRVGEAIADFMEKGRNPTVGTLAHLGQVDIRIAAKGADAASAESLITPVEVEIRRRLGDLIFGADGDTLESCIQQRLERIGWCVAAAELGSAGLVSERLGAGLPDRFAGSVVLPSEREALRVGVLTVQPGDAKEGALALARAASEWGAVEVGLGVLLRDVDGSAPPVTLAAIGVCRPGQVSARDYRIGGDRPSLRIRAATLALDFLRRSL